MRIEPLGSAGGMSGAQFWRITVVSRSADPARQRSLILRRWPTEHPTFERLQFIHAVLAHAAGQDINFLPLPIRATNGETFIQYAGHLWELAPWMPGTADYDRQPRVEKLCTAMIALAQFHLAVADYAPPIAPGSAGGSHAVNRHLARIKKLSSTAIDELSRAIHDTTWPELAPLARQFIAALPPAVPPAIARLEPLANAQLPLQPCLRDIWHDHILFTGDAVTGIIDFGAVDIDTPATDIARLLGSFADAGTVQAQTWREGLAAYSTVRPLSSDETQAAHALDASGTILAGCNWIRWIYINRRQFENHAQVLNRFRRILERVNSFDECP